MSARLTAPVRLLAGVLVLLAAVATATAPAHAAGGPPPRFTETSTGTVTHRVYGDTIVYGPGELTIRAGQPKEVTVAARLAAFDRTLPEPGQCEGAHGWISVLTGREVSDWLIGIGEVCGQHVQPPTSIVTHVFTGEFEVWEGHPSLVGTRGFMEIRLAADGTGSTFAVAH